MNGVAGRELVWLVAEGDRFLQSLFALCICVISSFRSSAGIRIMHQHMVKCIEV